MASNFQIVRKCLLVLAFSGALVLAGCGGRTDPKTGPGVTGIHPSSSVLQGWKTYTYGKARISVPRDWAVKHNSNCPDRAAPGTLILGSPNRPSQCNGPSVYTVSLSSLPADADPFLNCPTITINGLPAKIGPCATSDASGVVIYWIPALGVVAYGTGTQYGDVTGTGTGTVVGRILHTLRR